MGTMSLPGCLPKNMANGNFIPWREPPCVLPPGMSKSQIVAHLNKNIRSLHGWQSHDVSISANGLRVKLRAHIAVESPRNFRLIAKLPIGGNEADLGSNAERFWFWTRRGHPSQKFVFHSRHDQVQRGRHAIPIQPDWLLEVLGVIPLDETKMIYQPDVDGSGFVSLLEDRVAPDGRKVRRVILVSSCHGYIVSHRLYDAADKLLAKAELSDYQIHRIDGSSSVLLPQRIALDWPQTGMSLDMHIGHVEVNPQNVPDQTWKMPRYRGYPPFNLSRQRNEGYNSRERPGIIWLQSSSRESTQQNIGEHKSAGTGVEQPPAWTRAERPPTWVRKPVWVKNISHRREASRPWSPPVLR
jgi:hypothetical protein